MKFERSPIESTESRVVKDLKSLQKKLLDEMRTLDTSSDEYRAAIEAMQRISEEVRRIQSGQPNSPVVDTMNDTTSMPEFPPNNTENPRTALLNERAELTPKLSVLLKLKTPGETELTLIAHIRSRLAYIERQLENPVVTDDLAENAQVQAQQFPRHFRPEEAVLFEHVVQPPTRKGHIAE